MGIPDIYRSAWLALDWNPVLTDVQMGAPLDLETAIPDHSGFPLYGPSFTVSVVYPLALRILNARQLDVPAGMMRDHNSEESLQTIENTFQEIVGDIRTRLQT